MNIDKITDNYYENVKQRVSNGTAKTYSSYIYAYLLWLKTNGYVSVSDVEERIDEYYEKVLGKYSHNNALYRKSLLKKAVEHEELIWVD